MADVVQDMLLSGTNGMVQAPTGTGKSSAALVLLACLREHYAVQVARLVVAALPADACRQTCLGYRLEAHQVPASPETAAEEAGQLAEHLDSAAARQRLDPAGGPAGLAWAPEEGPAAPWAPEEAALAERWLPADGGPPALLVRLLQHVRRGETAPLVQAAACPVAARLVRREAARLAPRLMVLCRTHTQVAQVMRQLRDGPWGQRTAGLVLAAREHYCTSRKANPQGPHATGEARGLSWQGLHRAGAGAGLAPDDEAKAARIMADPEWVRSGVNERCELLCQDRACGARLQARRLVEAGSGAAQPAAALAVLGSATAGLRDIEDLLRDTRLRAGGACPYYVSRDLLPVSQVVVTPYATLLTPSARVERWLAEWPAVLLVDEAHNLGPAAMQHASFALSRRELLAAVATLGGSAGLRDVLPGATDTGIAAAPDVLRRQLAAEGDVAPRVVAAVGLCALVCAGDGLRRAPQSDAELRDHPRWAGVVTVTRSCGLDGCDALLERAGASGAAPRRRWAAAVRAALVDLHAEARGAQRVSPAREAMLSVLERTLRLLEQCGMRSPGGGPSPWGLIASHGYAALGGTTGPRHQALQYNKDFVLKPTALDAGLLLAPLARRLLGVLLLSGTLPPPDVCAHELGIPFGASMVAGHVVDVARQLAVLHVSHVQLGGRATPLALDYAGLGNQALVDAAGDMLVAARQAAPGGMLVFFASGRALDRFRASWQRSGALARLAAAGPLFWEEDGGRGQKAARLVRRYEQALGQPGQAATLLGVCRGGLSEGIDFRDHMARTVVIVGWPYAPRAEPSVSLMLDWHTQQLPHQRAPGVRSADQWYQWEAQMAVNQAMGRVLRHAGDWGAVLVLHSNTVFGPHRLPAWMGPAYETVPDAAALQRRLRALAAANTPQPAPHPHPPAPTPASTHAHPPPSASAPVPAGDPDPTLDLDADTLFGPACTAAPPVLATNPSEERGQASAGDRHSHDDHDGHDDTDHLLGWAAQAAHTAGRAARSLSEGPRAALGLVRHSAVVTAATGLVRAPLDAEAQGAPPTKRRRMGLDLHCATGSAAENEPPGGLALTVAKNPWD